jgi:Fe-S-cluster-containing dehydrogenase component
MQGGKNMTTKNKVKTQQAIVLDLEKCVGCYACEVACKQENSNARGIPWIRLNTIGPERIDGKLRMEYIPRVLDQCTFCAGRNMQPSCVDHCPTKALFVGSTAEILKALASNRRYQICTIKDL